MLLVGTNAFSRKKRHFLFVTLDYLIIHWLFVGFVVAPIDTYWFTVMQLFLTTALLG